MNRRPILECVDLCKKYGSLEVVKNVTLTMGEGEFISIVGKSGSGKTTLLSLLSGLEHPSSGRVIIDDRDITGASEDELALFRRENVGFVFQSFNLIPTLSAWENVALPLFPVKMPVEKLRERAMELLGRMDLEDRGSHLPSALSGGEKQRVAIARALVNNPRILFADEPTGNLDSHTGEAIMDILKVLHSNNGMSLLMVTHDLELAGAANRTIRIQDGEAIQ